MARRRLQPTSTATRPPAVEATTFPIPWAELAARRPVWGPKLALIAVVTLWIYGPALTGPFWGDDGWYLVTNMLVKSWRGLLIFWFQPGTWVEYYPLHETALWLEWHIFGIHTLGYHLVNVVLHVLNACLVWHLLGKFGLKFAWLGGLIFAVHPIEVDSVAVIVELKNTLSFAPFILAMCAWIDYARNGRARDYRLALGLFLVAMLCKISMAAFPVMILVYAWWRKGTLGTRDAVEAIPFFAISLVLGPLSIWASHRYQELGLAVPDVIPLGGFLSHAAITGLNLAFYFTQCVLPLDLAPFHRKWAIDPRETWQLLPWPVLAAVVTWCWLRRASWGRHALLGLAFFVVNLMPFLGFFPVSYMTFTWVFEHLLYIPSVGLIALFVAGFEDLRGKIPTTARLAESAAVVMIIALMALKGHAHAALFGDEAAIWQDALQRDPADWYAHQNFGGYYLVRHEYRNAIEQFRQEAALKPGLDEGHFVLAVAEEDVGDLDDAAKEYREAIAVNPRSIHSYNNLGENLRRRGHVAEAESILREGLARMPGDPSISSNLGGLLLQSGRIQDALDIFEHASADGASFPTLQYGWGEALLLTGDTEGAERHLAASVKRDSSIAIAHAKWGIALATLGRQPEAIEQFQAALQLDDSLIESRRNLALALAQTGRVPEAIDELHIVLQRDPNDAAARSLLAKLLAVNAPGQPSSR